MLKTTKRMTDAVDINKIKRVKEPRKKQFDGSFSVNDYYRYYKKNIIKCVDKKTYLKILREILEIISNMVSVGYDIKLPYAIGTITTRRVVHKTFESLPVDWGKTLEYWKNNPSEIRKTYIKRMGDNYWVKLTHSDNLNKYLRCIFSRSLKTKISLLKNNNMFDAIKQNFYGKQNKLGVNSNNIG